MLSYYGTKISKMSESRKTCMLRLQKNHSRICFFFFLFSPWSVLDHLLPPSLLNLCLKYLKGTTNTHIYLLIGKQFGVWMFLTVAVLDDEHARCFYPRYGMLSARRELWSDHYSDFLVCTRVLSDVFVEWLCSFFWYRNPPPLSRRSGGISSLVAFLCFGGTRSWDPLASCQNCSKPRVLETFH